MKINQLSDAYASTSVQGPSGEGRTNAAGSSKSAKNTPAPGQSVVVSLSEPVRSAARSGLENAPINVEKVQAIRAEVETGTYRVNPERIADGLLKSTADYLNTSTS